MKQAYIKQVVETQPGEAQDYIFDDKVDPRKILVVRNISVWWSGMASTEEALFFVEDGGRKCYLGDDLPSVNDGKPHWSGYATVGEGDRVGAYIPDIDANEVAYLWIFGELWDLEGWMKASD